MIANLWECGYLTRRIIAMDGLTVYLLCMFYLAVADYRLVPDYTEPDSKDRRYCRRFLFYLAVAFAVAAAVSHGMFGPSVDN
jgi:hypothetical protein